MALITLQFGQCGTQVGNDLFSNIYNDLQNSFMKDGGCSQAILKWFNIDKNKRWEPRSILVDTDKKSVILNTSMPYKFKTVVSKSCGGSANNWAFGYTNQSKLLVGNLYDTLRTEVEKCDLLSGFLNIFSLSGGTGSGVGSYITECLKDEFPNKSIINSVISPYVKGEVTVQSYNSLLTLAKIYPICDSIILFENDRLQYLCKNSLNIENISFANINQLIAHKLISVFYPINKVQNHHLLAGLCAHPSFKFLQIKNAPFLKTEHNQNNNWRFIMGLIQRQARFDFQQQRSELLHLKSKSVATALICRGISCPTELDLKSLKENTTVVSWVPKNESFQLFHHPRKIFGVDNSIAVISNSNSVCVPIKSIVSDAESLFKSGAYIHHYKKFGIDEQDFNDSFDALDSIFTKYQKL